MTPNTFWDKTWLFIRLGLIRRTQEYGTKLVYITWVIFTLLMVYLVDKRPENEYAIVRDACPDWMTIEARAESVYWGNVAEVNYFCKETK